MSLDRKTDHWTRRTCVDTFKRHNERVLHFHETQNDRVNTMTRHNFEVFTQLINVRFLCNQWHAMVVFHDVYLAGADPGAGYVVRNNLLFSTGC